MHFIETILGYQIDWGATAAVLALILSIINFWFTFLYKGKPVYACSKWTTVQLKNNQGAPRAAFALTLSIYNKGNSSLKVFDLYLQVVDDKGEIFYYEPIVLWDLKQWIKSDKPQGRVGRTQKGMVPLPTVIVPDQEYDFDYPILFMPDDTEHIIDPNKTDSLEATLYARTDRKKNYEKVATQKFTQEDLQGLNSKAFVSILSNESIEKRDILKEKIEN